MPNLDTAGIPIDTRGARDGLELNRQRLGDLALCDDAHRCRHADELGRDQNAKVVMTQPAIRSQVLVLNIGVDRHLGDLASTGGADEVNRHRAALLLQDLASIVGDLDLHALILEQRAQRRHSSIE